MNYNEIFENAVKSTYQKWRENPGQRKYAIDNIIKAISMGLSGNYQGFTRQNSARNNVQWLGYDGICYALIYNIIQLGDMKHQRINGSFDWMDPYISIVTKYCLDGDFSVLENMINVGVKEIIEEQNALDLFRITDGKVIAEQKARFKEHREMRGNGSQMAYDLANCLIVGYACYHTAYEQVSAKTEIKTMYDRGAASKLTNYYKIKTIHQEANKNY